jgi:hypothetical protein
MKFSTYYHIESEIYHLTAPEVKTLNEARATVDFRSILQIFWYCRKELAEEENMEGTS